MEIKKLDLTKKFADIKKNEQAPNKKNSETITSNIIFYFMLYGDYNYYKNYLKFFCDASFPLRGEKATYTTLAKNTSVSQYAAIDTLRMFSQAYEFLSDAEKKKVLREGLTQYNHDMLAKIINHNKNKNVDFKLTKAQLKLEDEIDGYEFTLPKDYHGLIDLGTAMHNCVASYKDKVIAQTSTIVYAAKGDEFCACIEIKDKNRVVQNLGKYNQKLEGEVVAVVDKWTKKHGLE